MKWTEIHQSLWYCFNTTLTQLRKHKIISVEQEKNILEMIQTNIKNNYGE